MSHIDSITNENNIFWAKVSVTDKPTKLIDLNHIFISFK